LLTERIVPTGRAWACCIERQGGFAEYAADRDKESHFGARAVGLNHDGDFDIVSIA